MRKAFKFCVPTRGTKVPAAPDWLHEIKHDGCRMMVMREGQSGAPGEAGGHVTADGERYASTAGARTIAAARLASRQPRLGTGYQHRHDNKNRCLDVAPTPAPAE
jgi:hypothetical protein